MSHEMHAAEIANQGYTVIPDVLDASLLAKAREALATVMAAETKVATAKGWQNASVSVAYLLPQKHHLFRGIGNNPKLLPIIRDVLGDDCRLGAVNGFVVAPGGEAQKLHMDAPQSTPGTCVYINALHCLDDFHETNGGTRLVPLSHKAARQSGTPADDMESTAVIIKAAAGSAIAYDGAVLHAASRNNTALPRRSLHLYYRRAWALPQWDYPRSLSRPVRAMLTEEEKTLFGFYDIAHLYDPWTHDTTRTFPHPRWKRIAKHLLRHLR